MEMTATLTEEKLWSFWDNFLPEEANQVKREILAFWGHHPNAKFDRSALCHALDYKKDETDRAIKDMVEARLVDTYMHNGTTFYSLSIDEEKRYPIVKLGTLDVGQWQQWLKLKERRG